MVSFFKSLLDISLEASITALAILAVKFIAGNKLNVRVAYWLWGLLLIRLFIPSLPQSDLSLFNGLSIIQSAEIKQQAAPSNETDTTANSSAVVAPATQSSEKPATEVLSDELQLTESSQGPFDAKGLDDILASIWLAIAVLYLSYFFYANIRFALKIRTFKAVELPSQIVHLLVSKMKLKRLPKIVESPLNHVPCVFGVFHPYILLPSGMVNQANEEALAYILAHELSHVKNRDLWVDWLFKLICAVHWFNPLLWYVASSIKKEQELCADARVLASLGEENTQAYGITLLNQLKINASAKRTVLAAGIVENKKDLEKRIGRISRFSIKKYPITVFGVLLIVFLSIFLCTSRAYFPKTAMERKQFDDNIMMGFSTNNAKDQFQTVDLTINNNNPAGIRGCELYIYNGEAGKSQLIYHEKGFSIGAGKTKHINVPDVDYWHATIDFSYKAGFALDEVSNKTSRSGALRIFDKTLELQGWGKVSDQELKDFLAEKHLEPISVFNIYGSQTIVFMERGTATGYYELYKDLKHNKVVSRLVQGAHSTERPAFERLGGTASGSYPFANILFNDPMLIEEGKMVEITTDYETLEYPLIKAMAIELRGRGNIRGIRVLNGNDEVIFSKYD